MAEDTDALGALTVWGEASQSHPDAALGRLGVAHVVQNRLKNKKRFSRGKGEAKTIFHPSQFDFFNSERLKKFNTNPSEIELEAFASSAEAFQEAKEQQDSGFTFDDATHFVGEAMFDNNPQPWMKRLRIVGRVAGHVFLSNKRVNKK